MSRFLGMYRAFVTLLSLLAFSVHGGSRAWADSPSNEARKLIQGYYIQALVYRDFIRSVKVENGPVFLSVKGRSPEDLVFSRVGCPGFVQPISQLDSYRARWKRHAQLENKPEQSLHRGVELGIQGLRWISRSRVVVVAWSQVNPSSSIDYDWSEYGQYPLRSVRREGAFERKVFQLHRRGVHWRLVKVRTLFAGG